MTTIDQQQKTIDILGFQNYYLVGIKGVAMTGLAQILTDAGKQVRGSDTPESFVTDHTLQSLGCTIDTHFSAAIPAETECLIYTGAHQGSKNPQVIKARQQQLPTYTHAQALGSLSTHKRTVAVCGVGGKSTTAAMLTWILEKTGMNPSYSVGVGEIHGLGRNAAWRSNSEIFIIEADEYTEDPSRAQETGQLIPRFEYIQPEIVICTNISFDHPDVYSSLSQTQAVFERFFNQIKSGGTLITQQSVQAAIPHHVRHQTYGQSGNVYYTLEHTPEKISVTITDTHSKVSTSLQLQIPGEHNIENATAAIAAAQLLGIPIADSAKALQSFASTSRRFELLGSYQGATLYDDYAHHPRELAAIVQTLQTFFAHKRCIVAFQPHTFSRTEALFDEFVAALSALGYCIILDVFGSAREQQTSSSISSEQLVAAIQAKNPAASCIHLPGVQELAAYCQKNLQQNDIFITLGAGDIYTVHKLLLSNQ